ncbi:MAG: methionine adenosyltransferase [Endomicrobiia bacterium]|nr:methionine adenosyltransferase [Endomicrobiia bacterium]
MKRKSFVFTSESVGEGHPDKVCDQISDSILDAILAHDPAGRVACETFITKGLVIVGGEITTKTFVRVHELVRGIVEKIGYTDPKYGFDYKTCAILNAIHSQSPDIAQGVDTGGAGDQGTMFGYACRETSELMPLPIMLAHKLVKKLADVRRSGELPYLGPDCKSQVSIEYIDGKPVRVRDVVIACQHTADVLDKSGRNMRESAKREIVEKVVKKIIPAKYLSSSTKYHVNATGKFVVGGPQSDTGMTGRKIVVDTYGGWAPHGGGAFSGKDPTKVDRSATYMTRYIAKNIVAAGVADECMTQLAYCIGEAEPVSVLIDTKGTGKVSDEKISKIVRDIFPLTPRGIISHLKLTKPVYVKTAAYGHFGRAGFTWEATDKVAAIRRAI